MFINTACDLFFIFYVPHSSSEAPEAVKAGFTLQGSSDPLPDFISSCVAPIGRNMEAGIRGA